MKYALRNRSNIIAAQNQEEEFKFIRMEGNWAIEALRTIIVKDKGTKEIFWMDFKVSTAQQTDSDQNSHELIPQHFQIQVQTRLSTFFSRR